MADKRRKGSKADAAYRKEVEALAKAAAEKARLMQATAEAAPTAQQVQAAQQAQEAIEHAPTAQQVQETKEAISAETDKQVNWALSPQLSEQLTDMPLSRLSLLPAETQQLVWNDLARRIVDTPGFNDALISLAEAERQAAAEFAEIAPALTERIQIVLNAAHSTLIALQPKLQAAQRSLEAWKQANITDDMRQAMQLLGTLAPYMDAEAAEHPELYDENTPASALVAAAARRARAEGKDIPRLSAEQADAEQKEIQLDLPTEGTAKEDKQPAGPSPLELARSAGAITSLENHVATIADKVLQYCFTSRDLKGLPGDYDKFVFDPTGKLNELSLNGEPLQPLDDIHTGFCMALLQIANLFDVREYNSKDNAAVGIYLPAFFRETGIDLRPHDRDKQTKQHIKRQAINEEARRKQRRDRFIEFMKPLDNRVGAIEGEGYYTVARFSSYDEKSETAYIIIPYWMKLAEIAKLHADNHSAISTIFRANVLTENPAAVELANRIAVGLIERGVTRPQDSTYNSTRKPSRKTTTTTAADGKKTTTTLYYEPEIEPGQQIVTLSKTNDDGVTKTVTTAKPKRERTFEYSTKFSTLIAECPQMQRDLAAIRGAQGPEETKILEEAKQEGRKPNPDALAEARKRDHKTDPQRINKVLKDRFDAAIRIIMKKSDIPAYYKDIQIRTGKREDYKAPTSSTLNDELIIKHGGKNPQWDA